MAFDRTLAVAAAAAVIAMLALASIESASAAVPGWTHTRMANPARTQVTASDGRWLATLTDGAQTVTLAGPERRLDEPSAADPVITSVWVRALDRPFDGHVDETWLADAMSTTQPDVLALAMGYLTDAPDEYDASGRRIAGDADYGPLQADGTRQEGSDFNDFLGMDYAYGSTVDRAESAQIGSLDCSGFMRMVWGQRAGLALTLAPNGAGIPRRSFEILASAPGVVTIANRAKQVTKLSKLAVGDLVFFDASSSDGSQIDHVGMYLGLDGAARPRFVSSRKTANGPTMGDVAGRSVLDGTGLYAKSLRAARRL